MYPITAHANARDAKTHQAVASPPFPASKSTAMSPISSPAPRSFFSLPSEVLSKVYEILDIPDRLKLRRVCSTLKNVYDSSAILQYEYTLQTTSYLDVPNRLPFCHPAMPISTSPIHGQAQQRPTPDATICQSEKSRINTSDPRPTVNGVHLAPLPPRGPRPSKTQVDLSLAEKNERLKDRERRWDTLDAIEKRTFKLVGPVGVYELQEGVLLMCDDYSEDEESRPESIRLIPLPSADDPDLLNPSIQTIKFKLPFRIADLTMDPTQDLIVVSEFLLPSLPRPTHRYHLLRLSNFEPHPLAESPQLDFPPFLGQPTRTRQLLQVMGDTLVVLVSRFHNQWVMAGFALIGLGAGGVETDEEIVAWNWKTGKVLGRLPLPLNAWFSSFAILTPTSIMITTPSPNSHNTDDDLLSVGNMFLPVIQIWSFLPDPNHTFESAQPLVDQAEDDTTFRPRLVAQLDLPAFSESANVSEFSVRPDPAFPPTSIDPTVPRIGHKGFTQDPEKGVLVFELEVMEPSESVPGILDMISRRSYELFVLRETLVNLAKQGEDRLRAFQAIGGIDDGTGAWKVDQQFSWSEWGEKHARLLDGSMRKRVWVCSCSGYRFVSLIPSLVEDERRGREVVEVEVGVDEEGQEIYSLLDEGPVDAMEGESDDDDEDEDDIGDDDDDDDDGEGGDQDGIDFAGVDPPTRLSDIRIYDFSPIRVKRDQLLGVERDDENSLSSDEPKFHIVLHDEPTVLPRRRVWKDDVKSGLKFREIVRKVGLKANGVMMDDQRIIMINSQHLSSIRTSQEMTVLCM